MPVSRIRNTRDQPGFIGRVTKEASRFVPVVDAGLGFGGLRGPIRGGRSRAGSTGSRGRLARRNPRHSVELCLSIVEGGLGGIKIGSGLGLALFPSLIRLTVVSHIRSHHQTVRPLPLRSEAFHRGSQRVSAGHLVLRSLRVGIPDEKALGAKLSVLVLEFRSIRRNDNPSIAVLHDQIIGISRPANGAAAGELVELIEVGPLARGRESSVSRAGETLV